MFHMHANLQAVEDTENEIETGIGSARIIAIDRQTNNIVAQNCRLEYLLHAAE